MKEKSLSIDDLYKQGIGKFSTRDDYLLFLRKASFLDRAYKKFGDRYIYRMQDYSDYHTLIGIECPKHGVFLSTPARHITSITGCRKCDQDKRNSVRSITKKIASQRDINRGKDLFIKEARLKFNDKYTYKIEDTDDRIYKVQVTCPIHGAYYTTAATHLESTTGCLECDVKLKVYARGTHVKTLEKRKSKFLGKAREKFGSKFNYYMEDYKRPFDLMRIECPKHGVFLMAPTIHLSSVDGCDSCHIGFSKIPEKRRSSMDVDVRAAAFIHSASKKFSSRFKYYIEDYINAKSEIRIKCPVHGIFKMKPNLHISNVTGCYACSKNRLEDKFKVKAIPVAKKFIDRANKRFNYKFDYSKLGYTTAHSRVTIICPKHGEFTTTPISHINSKYGCSKCGMDAFKVYLVNKREAEQT